MAREIKCCMCPANEDFTENVCTKDTKYLGDIIGICDFKVRWVDDRGWLYFVRGGIGEGNYKTFFKKPDKNGAYGCRAFEWRESFSEAQEDLNQYAICKGWKEVSPDEALCY